MQFSKTDNRISLVQIIETCIFCGQEFDVAKRDNSGYISRIDPNTHEITSVPVYAGCREGRK